MSPPKLTSGARRKPQPFFCILTILSLSQVLLALYFCLIIVAYYYSLSSSDAASSPSLSDPMLTSTIEDGYVEFNKRTIIVVESKEKGH